MGENIAPGSPASDRRSAFGSFFGALFVSDLILGLHGLIPVVYGSLVPVLWIGFRLKKDLRAWKIAGAALLGSLIYFSLTNFGVWALGGCGWIEGPEFPKTPAGLMLAYAAALPGLPTKLFVEFLGSALLLLFLPRACKWPTELRNLDPKELMAEKAR